MLPPTLAVRPQPRSKCPIIAVVVDLPLVPVTATIGGRSGRFVMQDVGTCENGLSKGRWMILPGLGSGELADIRGDGHFAANADGASYLLDVVL